MQSFLSPLYRLCKSMKLVIIMKIFRTDNVVYYNWCYNKSRGYNNSYSYTYWALTVSGPKHFTYINLFNLHNNVVNGEILLLHSLYRWENKRAEIK